MDTREAALWRDASRMLAELLDLPESARSHAAEEWIRQEPAGAELKRLMDGLETRCLLDQPFDQLLGDLEPPTESLTGEQLGEWRVGDEIGRGGMSVVYEAFRSGERFEQRAALKVLALSFMTPWHTESFHRECQALSALNHPGIAHLIHSGSTPSGRPYMIIEYVEGEPIDRYVEQRGLDTESRVNLVIELCEAMAHAHRHLFIHRDISPKNVLVDRRGRPRLLDFGVAEWLQSGSSAQPLPAYTPGYAAPEQVDDMTVTTATDIYGLGRLLRRLLRDTSDPELDAVIARATLDDPRERYQDAEHLAADLRAWRTKRPVSALPATALYRARKFAARNALWLALSAGLVLAVIAGTVTTLQQKLEADLQASRHRAVADFMSGLFAQADILAAGSELKVTDLLTDAAARAPDTLAKQPEALLELYTLIASGQIELTRYDAADDVLARAGALIESNELSAPGQAAYLIQRGRLNYERGEYATAAEDLEAALSLLSPAGSARDLYFSAGASRVSYLVDAESYEQALDLSRTLQRQAREHPPGALTTALLAHRHAVALEVNGEVNAALRSYEQALALQSQAEPDNTLGRAQILNDLGVALYLEGRYGEAEQHYREVLRVFEEHFEAPHPRISSALHNLGFAIVEQDRIPEALSLLEQSAAMSLDLHGPDHVDSILEQVTLATVLAKAGESDRAESLLRDNIERMERIAPDMNIQLGAMHTYLADLLFSQQRFENAAEQYGLALSLFADLPPDHVRVQQVQEQLEKIALAR